MSVSRILLVGAGLSGAVIGRELAKAGYEVDIVDQRSHVAGNCHTARDEGSGVMIHVYGPHIFHTDDEEVWQYVNSFSIFKPFLHRVKTTVGNAVYLLPINLHTINQFFGSTLNPSEAEELIASKADHSITAPQSFEEQALRFVGNELYEAFLKGYTKKQWGRDPNDLPAKILKRLPVRFNYDDNYFFHTYQGIPEEGYTAFVGRILDHDNITVYLNTAFDFGMKNEYRHVFYSGPLDGYFNYSEGYLGYRTLDFERIDCEGDFQGCPVMNYGDESVPYTRITEHKHFSPWESHRKSVCYREYSRECGEGDIPYYPIRLVHEKELLARYVDMARSTKGVTFVGRLGTYRYLDMDVTIREALDAARGFMECFEKGRKPPAFFVEPL